MIIFVLFRLDSFNRDWLSPIASGVSTDLGLDNVYHENKFVACGGQLPTFFILADNCTIATNLKHIIDGLAGACDGGVIVRTMKIIKLCPFFGEVTTPIVSVTKYLF